MKKAAMYVLSLLCLVVPLSLQAADPWGLLNNLVSGEKSFVYAVDKVLADATIRYAVDSNVTPQEEQLFVDAIRRWPRETLNEIKRLYRTEEFPEIVPLLEREIKLEKTFSLRADIILRISNSCREGSFGCFSEDNRTITITPAYRHIFASTVLHEVGHYWGLSDQYEGERYNSHPNYSSDQNTEEGSVMNESDHLTCDDFDGLINLLDFRLSQRRGSFSKRVQDGWWGLCPTPNFYQEINTVGRKELDRLIHSPIAGEARKYDSAGQMEQHAYLLPANPVSALTLFTVRKGDHIIYDMKGRIGMITSRARTPFIPLVNGKSVRRFGYADGRITVYDQDGNPLAATGSQPNDTITILFTPDHLQKFQIPGTEFSNINGVGVYVYMKDGQIDSIASKMWGEDPHCGKLFALLRYDYKEKKFASAEIEGCQQAGYFFPKTDGVPLALPAHMLPIHHKVVKQLSEQILRQLPLVNNWYRNFYRPAQGFVNKKMLKILQNGWSALISSY